MAYGVTEAHQRNHANQNRGDNEGNNRTSVGQCSRDVGSRACDSIHSLMKISLRLRPWPEPSGGVFDLASSYPQVKFRQATDCG